MQKSELIELKKAVLENRFDTMNSMQKQAIFQVNGPVLILAGAGSGKTTVLVNRIANMLYFGDAFNNDSLPETLNESDETFLKEIKNYKKNDYDVNHLKEILKAKPISPWNILAITFTNKAAKELKIRLSNLEISGSESVNAGTFHSICVRILRKEISVLGYKTNFAIYDTDDSQRVIKECLNQLELDEKTYSLKSVLHAISRAKDSLISPSKYAEENTENDPYKTAIGNIYKLYQKQLKASNVLDFDDIICLTVKLFTDFPEVLNHYQNLYKYVLVDEYQDTNHAQFMLVSMLSQSHKNLCVVGDDDQSIYKFRGATIENILSFETRFKNALVIRLEQNYRSTQNILDAANTVIKNNSIRKGKNLWTDNGTGEKLTAYRSPDEVSEAQFVVKRIEEGIENGLKFNDHAILYRMNAQSSTIERQFVRAGIPYKIVGGHKFYDRKEIKDILAYFHIMENPFDNIRMKRVVNEPKRGIGDTTVKYIQEIADENNISMLDVMGKPTDYQTISKKAQILSNFYDTIKELQVLSQAIPLDQLLDALMDKTGYWAYLKSQGKDGEVRLENISELKSNLLRFSQENEEPTLAKFLEEVSLFTDLDNINSADDNVTLMTMHSAKGLEFKVVFIVGMEDGIFPSYLSTTNELELEEERRLAYVAITRAKEKLYLTNSSQRMLFGRTTRNMPSRFLKEIPDELSDVIDDTVKAYGFAPRPVKAKAVYKPEIEGIVGL
ncbi:MAG: 3'-5' exonuclease, partial [Oscillospiraceae bacterium]